MFAREQTDAMLGWWRRVGVGRVDLAVKKPDGTMMWHLDIALDRIPLSWARAANARGCEIYIRPASSRAWPLVFLDDVPMKMARRIARRYRSLVVVTSEAGGCHLWITCSRCLTLPERAAAQRWLATRCEADRASTSGDHLGRLAGFKDWKRGGCWVNIVGSHSGRSTWDPAGARHGDHIYRDHANALTHRTSVPAGTDRSESGREWGWVCGQLEVGSDPARILAILREHARTRRGRDADRYARRTVAQALQKVSIKRCLSPGTFRPVAETTGDPRETP